MLLLAGYHAEVLLVPVGALPEKRPPLAQGSLFTYLTVLRT